MSQSYDDLTNGQLIEILKRRDRERKLGLVWERRELEADSSVNSDFVIPERDEELSYGGDGRANAIIEADNFDALRLLRTTHAGAIKFIYIDPPYNSGKTANSTFVYNDRFVDPKDDYRHSKWLELMYQRLWLAKDLLAPDGLIFVSIDDGEMARLKLLMDIVFPENFQACLVWQSDGNSDNTAAFKVQHEYILVYSRDKREMFAPPVIDPNIDANESKLFNDEKRNTFVKNGAKNPKSALVLPAGFPASFEGGVIGPRSGGAYPNHTLPIEVENFQVKSPVEVFSGWQAKTLFERFVAQDFAPVIDAKGQLTSYELDKNGAIQSFKPREDGQSHVLSVIRNVGSVQKTKAFLKSIGIAFDYPKPVLLIEYLLQMIPGKDFVALDFFAGTGTTAEAVSRLNSKDNGSRSWIMVSSTEATVDDPNKNVCRDACARRVQYFFKNDGANIESAQPSLFGFTYQRIKRVKRGEIDISLTPSAAWDWIQYAHSLGPKLYDDQQAFQTATLPDGELLIFVDRATPSAIASIAESVSSKAAYIYTWTPGRFDEISEDGTIEIRAIPLYFEDKLIR